MMKLSDEVGVKIIMGQQTTAEEVRRQRQAENKAALFAADPRTSEEISQKVQAAVANELRGNAAARGIEGTTFTQWVEDVAAEGICRAAERAEKWDKERGSEIRWAVQLAVSFGTRRLRRLPQEHSIIERLGRESFPNQEANSLGAVDSDWTGEITTKLSIDQLLERELSGTQQRMLRHLLDGLTVEEIAELEGYSQETTKRYISRARAKARRVGHLYGIDGLRHHEIHRPREPDADPEPHRDGQIRRGENERA